MFGAPGAGKGTQAIRIARSLGIPAVSTGDIFRDNIKNETVLGLKVKGILAAGAYVPDEVTNAIVRDRLDQPDAAGGFLLDGYPRTQAQVRELDVMLSDRGTSLDAVLELTVDTDEVVQRLLKRAEIDGRSDDAEDVIRHRLKLYDEETAPLAALYRARGLLRQVDGMGEMDAVTGRIQAVIATLQS